MKTQKKEVVRLEFDVDDVRRMLIEHINKNTNYDLDYYKISGIDHITKKILISGINLHDADHMNVFDGLKVVLVKQY